jgi:hypothetical protein
MKNKLFKVHYERTRNRTRPRRMNYLQQIKGFWVAQNAHSFSAEEIGLYFYLLEVSNNLRWTNPFKRNNYKIMADLEIKDRRTLERYRNSLKQGGIIEFKTRNGDANVAYTLADLSIFCTGYSPGNSTGYSSGSRSGDGTDNTNKGKPKPSSSEPNGSVDPKVLEAQKLKEEKEKKLAAKKEKEEKELAKTPFFVEMKQVWLDFYGEHYEHEPKFQVLEATNLANIVKRLKKLSDAKEKEWSLEYAKHVFTHFLLLAYADEWRKNNFLLPTLYSKFDAIINRKNEQGITNKQAGLDYLKADIASDLAKLTGKVG